MTGLRHGTGLSANQLVGHILENPRLLAAVRELPGRALGALINSVGLEDSSELVALASYEQLEAVFDEDLWRAEPGRWEEQFDSARFGLWLHAFWEAGGGAVVRFLTKLPEEFVILAIHRLVLVIDIDGMAAEMSEVDEDNDRVEKALDSCTCEEWEEFRLISRDEFTWDEVSQALLALDRDHHQLLRRILERCAAMSFEWIEGNGGLYSVLTSDEMLEGDLGSLLRLLERANVLESTHHPQLVEAPRRQGKSGAIVKTSAPFERLLDGALATLRDSDPRAYQERMDELAFLTNVLVAAPQRQTERLRPIQALERALAVVDRGLALELVTEKGASADERREAALSVLRKVSADWLFRRAFPMESK